MMTAEPIFSWEGAELCTEERGRELRAGYPEEGTLACGRGDSGTAAGCTGAVSHGASPMLNSSEFLQLLLSSSFKNANQVGRCLSFH